MDENNLKQEENINAQNSAANNEASPATPSVTIQMDKGVPLKTLIIFGICGAAVLIIVSFIVADWMNSRTPTITKIESVDFATIQYSIKEIGELVTLAYHYEAVGVFEDSSTIELFRRQVNIPGTARSIIYTFEGNIRFGIDMDKIEVTIIPLDEENHSVSIALPSPSIKSSAVNLETVRVLDESTGIFVSFDLDEFAHIVGERQLEAEARALSQNFIQQAKDNTELVLTAFLRNVLDDEYYKISFAWN